MAERIAYRGCELPADRYYDIEGDLWITFEGDLVRLGLTDVAQTRMGKLLSIRFKQPGRLVKAGGSVATIESAKWVGPVHSPFAGEVVAINEEAFAADILAANKDPYGAAWVTVVRPQDLDAPIRPLLHSEAAQEAYKQRIDELEISCFRCADDE